MRRFDGCIVAGLFAVMALLVRFERPTGAVGLVISPPPPAPGYNQTGAIHSHLMTNRLQFDIRDPKTPLIELQNRVLISKSYFALGESAGRHQLSNTAVGVLDASIPVPNDRIRKRSEYGSLLELLAQVENDGGFEYAKFTKPERDRLFYLATRRNKMYLMLLYTEVTELLKLLERIHDHKPEA